MRISVNSELCNGHGRCYTVSPDVYAPDDDGYCADRDRSRDKSSISSRPPPKLLLTTSLERLSG